MVSQEEVTQLLEAANWAPTHGKTEPWRFAVLASREAQLKAFEVVLEVRRRAPAAVSWRSLLVQSCVDSLCSQ